MECLEAFLHIEGEYLHLADIQLVENPQKVLDQNVLVEVVVLPIQEASVVLAVADTLLVQELQDMVVDMQILMDIVVEHPVVRELLVDAQVHCMENLAVAVLHILQRAVG